MSHVAELDDLVARKRIEVARKREQWPVSMLMRRARSRPPPLALVPVLDGPGIAVIAEIKNRSFGGGNYLAATDANGLARAFADNGAAAIAVLADGLRFGGSSILVEEAVAGAARSAPVIYKDFVVSSYQVLEARALGADSVLVVMYRLDPPVLGEIVAEAGNLGMDCAIEVFSAGDCDAALRAGARVIGINNRDLMRSKIDFERAVAIRASVPDGVVCVSESGLQDARDVQWAGEAGFDAVLVGDAILGAPDSAETLREFVRTGASVVRGRATEQESNARKSRGPR